jgi:hypothetical protein
MVDWYLEGISFGNCNCDYGCPCQFELRPTYGNCRGLEMARIDKGRFGDVQLDGLCFALLYAWPGAVFEGGGAMQAVIDERADEPQRKALLTILEGGETREAATHWWVYRAMSSTVHPPLFKPIHLDVDIESRRAKMSIPGLLESSGRPIVSPVTGDEHRVRIDLPNGIEFEIAEIASGSTRASGAVVLELDDSYGQFNRLHHTGAGLVRGAA